MTQTPENRQFVEWGGGDILRRMEIAKPSAALPTYLALAFGLSWLIALPLWLGEGLRSPLLTVVSIAMMFTPALAAIVTSVVVERRRPKDIVHALGIWPLGRVWHFLGYLAVALVLPVVLCFSALVVGSWFGVYSMDLESFSGFAQVIEQQSKAKGTPLPPIPVNMLVLIQIASIPVGAFINVVPALGEELGWRGWLQPHLERYGTVPAMVLTGVIWGLWHAPVVLLGYNYPLAPNGTGLAFMVVFCVITSLIFGWLRLRTRSVWPAALAHGSLNAAAGMAVLFAKADTVVDTRSATVLGWSGWIMPLILIAVLYATKQLRPAEPAEPVDSADPEAPAPPPASAPHAR